jgi:REP element-mobilizing transposase RayT
VVMDDHVHVLLSLAEGHTLQAVLHSWKSYTAHRLRRSSDSPQPVWQDEYFDRIVRDEKELRRAAQYLAHNPIKRWPELEEYQWLKFYDFEA